MIRTVNLQTLEHRELRSSTSGEVFARSALISEALGIGSIFVHHDIIPPGRRASARHFHTTRDEIVVVLSGRIRAHHADAETIHHEGDVIALPAGRENSHAIANDGDVPAVILVIASNAPDDEVVYE